MAAVCFQKLEVSAVDWDVSFRFGMQIDFDLLKQAP